MRSTRCLTFSFPLSVVFAGCAAAAPDGPRVEERALLEELRASQSTGYAVPETGDLRFTVAAAFAPGVWAKLDEQQLLDWERCWRKALTADDRPRVMFTRTLPTGSTVQQNLFELSAKDGFCVVMALHGTDKQAKNTDLSAGLDRILDPLRAP
ncbi:MAG: hypothetical protein U1E73_00855 [Planctomycetota bacterium]